MKQQIAQMSRIDLVDELLASPYAESGQKADKAKLSAGKELAILKRKLAVAKAIMLRDMQEKMMGKDLISSPAQSREWLKLRYAGVEHEAFILLHLDARNRLLSIDEIFRGTLTYTSVYPREVLKSALESNSASVIFVHNHPSGDTDPSQSDQTITLNLKNALALVDIRVIDHLIVGADKISSFAELGML